jgi:hypothetical protein
MTLNITRIVVHGGGAHRDDFMSVCIALAMSSADVEVVRRDPTPEELDSTDVLVLDVGMKHEPAKLNFDHHQLSRDAEPACALSLFNSHFDLGLEMYNWFNFTSVLDSKGPMVAAKIFGMSKDSLMATLSPVEAAMIKIFEQGVDLRTVMAQIGKDTLDYVSSVRACLCQLRAGAGTAESVHGLMGICCTLEKPELKAIEMLRAEFEKVHGPMAFSITRDDRGEGFSLYRFDDHPGLDFSKLQGNPAVTFAHVGGFIAKTSKMAVTEAIELVGLAVV